MHPELRLIEDFLTDRGVLSLPALPRMLYVVRGAINVGQRVLGQGEALFGEELLTAHAEGTGATLWRFELSDPRQPAAQAQWLRPSLDADARASPLEHLPEGDLLWRGDSVAFPPGGCAYLHRHQGPGIRCLIEGTLRIDCNGQSHSYDIGDPWFENGTDPVFAQAGDRADALRARADPAAHADREKLDPVRQRRGQGEAEEPAVSRLCRRAADAAGSFKHEREVMPLPARCAWIASAWTLPASSRGERRVDHPVALDPALPLEGLRYNIDPEMRLPARPVARCPSCWCDSSTTRRLAGAKAPVNFSVMMSAVRIGAL